MPRKLALAVLGPALILLIGCGPKRIASSALDIPALLRDTDALVSGLQLGR